jgi:hypothetical protein
MLEKRKIGFYGPQTNSEPFDGSTYPLEPVISASFFPKL